MDAQLKLLHEKMLSDSNDYEDRIVRLQTEINKKEKDVRLCKETINTLKY